MTDETSNKFKEFVELTKREVDLEEILTDVNSERPGRFGPGRDKVLEIGYNLGIEAGRIDRNRTKEEVRYDVAENYVKEEYQKRANDATHYFDKENKEIINEASNETLESLLGIEDFVNSIKGSNRKVLSAYSEVVKNKSLKERFENKEGIREEEAQEMKKYLEAGIEAEAREAYETARKKEAERQEKLGYRDIQLQETAGKLSEQAVKAGLNVSNEKAEEKQRNYIIKGIDARLAEAEQTYNEIKDENGDIYKAIRESVIEVAESKNDKLVKNVRRILYALGSRENPQAS
ncbi:MAG: hypothetical protein AABX73_04080 [Nanoarchaeota archaeon]